MTKENYTLTEAEEQQLHIRVASATWIGMLSTHPLTAEFLSKQKAADDFMAAQKDLLEKCAAAKKVFPLLWIRRGRARFRPLRDRPLVGPYWIDRSRISESNLEWIVLPDFLAAMERRLYTQNRRICYAQFAAAYEQMSKAFDTLQAALMPTH